MMTHPKTYSIKECFYSPQGEGHRAGRMNVFLRFAGCNLQCTVEKEGFNCDTDFYKGEPMTLAQIVELVQKTDEGWCKNVIFTGGEPALQVDHDLCWALENVGYYLAIETNGTQQFPLKMRDGVGVNWVSCSPKPGAPVVIRTADEVRCVVQHGQIPDPQNIDADHYFVSPACNAPPAKIIKLGWKSSARDFDYVNMKWAVEWCRSNPKWRISLQTHKLLGVR
jgi:7-carboxy-7-deazaguanine synthase